MYVCIGVHLICAFMCVFVCKQHWRFTSLLHRERWCYCSRSCRRVSTFHTGPKPLLCPPPPFPLSVFIIRISLMKTVPNSKSSGCWSVWKRRTAQSTLPCPETGLQTLCSAVLVYVKTIHCRLNSDNLLLLPVLSTILVVVVLSTILVVVLVLAMEFLASWFPRVYFFFSLFIA